MATATVSRQRETMEQALTRLAQKAKAEGVKLQRDTRTGQYLATSGTQRGKQYAVTGFACECQGFERHGRCKHYAALQAALGFIHRPEETPSTAPAICEHCNGASEVPSLYAGMWSTPVYEACKYCRGTGQAVNVDRMAA